MSLRLYDWRVTSPSHGAAHFEFRAVREPRELADVLADEWDDLWDAVQQAIADYGINPLAFSSATARWALIVVSGDNTFRTPLNFTMAQLMDSAYVSDALDDMTHEGSKAVDFVVDKLFFEVISPLLRQEVRGAPVLPQPHGDRMSQRQIKSLDALRALRDTRELTAEELEQLETLEGLAMRAREAEEKEVTWLERSQAIRRAQRDAMRQELIDQLEEERRAAEDEKERLLHEERQRLEHNVSEALEALEALPATRLERAEREFKQFLENYGWTPEQAGQMADAYPWNSEERLGAINAVVEHWHPDAQGLNAVFRLRDLYAVRNDPALSEEARGLINEAVAAYRAHQQRHREAEAAEREAEQQRLRDSALAAVAEEERQLQDLLDAADEEQYQAQLEELEEPSTPRLEASRRLLEEPFGAYDQAAIEAARPFQTNDWYAANRKHLWRVENKNSLCFCYCLAIAERLSAYRVAQARIRHLRDTKQPVPPELLKAGSAKELNAIHGFRKRFSRQSELTKRAKEIASDLTGLENPLQYAFRFSDVVRAHNLFRTLVVVYTCEQAGERWQEMFRSDQVPPEYPVQPDDLDPEQRPVVFLYYTPPAEQGAAGHLDLIHDAQGLAMMLGVKNSTLCRVCLTAYKNVADHDCLACRDCCHPGCSAVSVVMGWSRREHRCEDCGHRFKTEECLALHKAPMPTGRGQLQGQSMAEAKARAPARAHYGGRNRRESRAQSVCQKFVYCEQPECRGRKIRQIKVKGPDGVQRTYEHQCGYELCGHCGQYENRKHECYVQRGKLSETEGDYVFYDSECHCADVHKPYLIRVHVGLEGSDERYLGEGGLGGYTAQREWVGERQGDYDKAGKQVKFFFEGNDCVHQFIAWLLRKRERDKKGCVVIAHNGAGYDWPIIYRDLVLWNGGSLGVRPTYRGSNLISIRLGYGEGQIRFADSYLFVSSPLSAFPQTFALGPQLQAAGFGGNKEFFPHWLYETLEAGENMDGEWEDVETKTIQYCGAFPPKEAYRPQHMKADRRAAFEAWYEEERPKYAPARSACPWIFIQQARDYCDQDVQVLRRGMRVFRNFFLELTMHKLDFEEALDRVFSQAANRMGRRARGAEEVAVPEPAQRGVSLWVGVDPLAYVTLPAAAMAAFRRCFMHRDSIANLPSTVDEIIRPAYLGGRCETFRTYWEALADTLARIRYVDVNSEYPAVMAACPYPLGYPAYYGTHEVWPHDSVELAGPARLEDLDEYLRPGTLAIMKVDVDCPNDLRLPVLGEHVKIGPAKKFVFSLNPKRDYWTNSVALRKALTKGYSVTAVHAVMFWDEAHVAPPAVDEKGNFDEASLFGAFIKRMSLEKTQASGWPRGCDTEEKKAAFAEAFHAHPLNMGNELDPDKVQKNPGLANVAKLIQNSSYGKWGQRLRQEQVLLSYEQDTARFWEVFHDPMLEVLRVIPIRESKEVEGITGVVELVYREKARNDEIEALALNPLFDRYRKPTRDYAVHAVHIAVFVTEHARQWLYSEMERLGDQVVYVDTDSIFYVHDPDNPEHRSVPTSAFLGGWKDELEGDYIVAMASGGPKNYAYRTESGKEKSVVKGLPRSALLPHFQIDFLRASVMAEALSEPARTPAKHVVKAGGLRRERKMQNVTSIEAAHKSFRMVNNKAAIFADGSTLPFGHHEIEHRKFVFRQEYQLWLAKLDEASERCARARRAQRDHDRGPEAKDEKGDEPDETEQLNEYLEREQRQRDRMVQQLANWRSRLNRAEREAQDDEVEGGEEDRDSAWMDLDLENDRDVDPDLFD